MKKYEVSTNCQMQSGRWTLWCATSDSPQFNPEVLLKSDDPVDIRNLLTELGIHSVQMDIDGNGSKVAVPVSWIGDGQQIVLSPRALALIDLDCENLRRKK